MKAIKLFFLVVSTAICTIINAQETSGVTGDCQWRVSETKDTLFIFNATGNGRTGNYSSSAPAPWFSIEDIKATLTTVIIYEGVKEIRNSFLYSNATYSFPNVNRVILPTSLISMGNAAFRGIGNCGNIVIPDNVKTIGDYCFTENLSVGTITLPEGLESIGKNAFTKSAFTGTLVLPNSIKFIGDQAFDQCAGFDNELVIPANLDTIRYRVFNKFGKPTSSSTGGILSFIQPSKLKYIGESAFEQAKFGKDCILPEGLESIDKKAFYGNNQGYTSVSLPSTLKSIADSAFMGCNKIRNIMSATQDAPILGLDAFFNIGSTPALLVVTEGGEGYDVVPWSNFTYANTYYKTLPVAYYNMYLNLSGDYQQLEESYSNLSEEYDNVEEANTYWDFKYDSLSGEHILLGDKYDSLSDEQVYLLGKYDSLSEEHTLFGNKYDSLSDEQVYLVWKYDSLSGKHIDLHNLYSDALEYVNILKNDSASLEADTVRLYNLWQEVLNAPAIHDTLKVHDTIFVPVSVHDTTFVPVLVHDTTYVPVLVHDTTYVTVLVHDTIYSVNDSSLIYENNCLRGELATLLDSISDLVELLDACNGGGDPTIVSDKIQSLILNLYPNPVVNDELNVKCAYCEENDVVKIYDYSGKLMNSKVNVSFNSNADGVSTISINVQSLPTGTYIITVGSRVAKFVKI